VDDLADILRQLEPSLGPVGGKPAPLEGGITNRNFRVRFAQHEYVVRLHGKDTDLLGISREAERLANDAAAGLGIAPAVAGNFDGGLVTRFLACESLASGQVAEAAEEIALALRAFHDSGTRLPVDFDVPVLLDEYRAIVGDATPEGYDELVEVVRRIARALPPWQPCPCHNDLLAGNILRAREDGRIALVDWEYAGMGHPYFDLGNLAVNNDFGGRDERRLLRAYHGAEPSDAQLARLGLMRVMSDAREAAWGVIQGQVSALDFDFGGYAEHHLRRLRATDFERWLSVAKG
jgi:thiamine kinase-like enzyme